jgi:hypothetical protein
MYTISTFAKDKIKELNGIPQSSIGAPCPMVIADEQNLAVAFYLEVRDDDWDGSTVRVVNPESEGEPFAVVNFINSIAYYHGAPNDESFSGHPLWRRGLKPYGAFEIINSSWLKHFIKMNRVHPYHKDENFAQYRHFILPFHDTTFECIAENYAVSTGVGSLREAAREIINKMK